MDSKTVLLFAAYGMGEGPEALQLKLAGVFLELIASQPVKPGRICFYTDGVKLACAGSPVLEVLDQLQKSGVELVLCKTCLDDFGILDKVKVGVVGGMPDIIEAMSRAGKVIRL
jgi:sulfur relay (sulfurtransferase) complex TusBCD TusD component (DsrE family)